MRRPLFLRFSLCLLPLALVVALGRCGEDEKKDKGSPQPAGAGVPADWDGTQDYGRSAFEVIEE